MKDCSPQDLSRMAECVSFNLRRFNRAITQFYVGEMDSIDLKPTQVTLLASLAGRESATMAEFSEWLGMDRTTLVRNLRPLLRRKLVRQVAAQGSRRQDIQLTDQGLAYLMRVFPLWEKAQEKVEATLGKSRWQSIFNDLQTATAKLNHQP
jgi:DNA-binding MarR family transcriptional regulator